MLKAIRGPILAICAAFAASGAVAQAPVPAVTSAPAAAVAAPAAAPAAAKPADIVHMVPTPGIGMPTDQIGLQPQETEIGVEAAWMHNYILVPVMSAMSVLVLVLLL